MNDKKAPLAAFGLVFNAPPLRVANDPPHSVVSTHAHAFDCAHGPSKPLDALLHLIGRNDESGVERLRRIVAAYLQMDQRRQDEAMVRMERIAHTHPKARATHLRLVPQLERGMERANDA